MEVTDLKKMIQEYYASNKKVYNIEEHQGWGNAIYLNGWERGKPYISGLLTPIPEEGSYLIIPLQRGTHALLKMVNIKRPDYHNPPDMFFADLCYLGIYEEINDKNKKGKNNG